MEDKPFSDILRNKDRSLVITLDNLTKLLLKEPAWNFTPKGAFYSIHVIGFDMTKQAIVKRGPIPCPDDLRPMIKGDDPQWTKIDTLILRTWFDRVHRANVSETLCDDIISVVAHKNSFDPRLMTHRTTAVEKCIQEMNEHYAIATLGSNAVILHETYDPQFKRDVIEFVTEKSLEIIFKNRLIPVPERNKSISLAAYWMQHADRRQYDRIVFLPGESNAKYYNLWKGWQCKPVKGSWEKMKQHIWENLCCKNEESYRYFIYWMADALQHPTVRPGVAVVMKGKRGTGKGKWWQWFSSLYGSHAMQVAQATQVTGKFNGHLQNCLLLNADEAFWAGDKASQGALQNLITEPMLTIERKGLDAIHVPCYLRLVFFSNEKWVVPAATDERRYLVLLVSDLHAQDTKYFAEIDEEMQHGGKEAMLEELLGIDLSSVNLFKVPQTSGLLEQKILTLAPIPRFWMGRLMDGEPVPGRKFGDWCPTSELHDLYIRECDIAGDRRRKVQMEFNEEFGEFCPCTHDRATVDSNKTDWGTKAPTRVRCFKLPPLAQARALFEKYLQSPVRWPNDETLSTKEETPRGQPGQTSGLD